MIPTLKLFAAVRTQGKHTLDRDERCFYDGTVGGGMDGWMVCSWAVRLDLVQLSSWAAPDEGDDGIGWRGWGEVVVVAVG